VDLQTGNPRYVFVPDDYSSIQPALDNVYPSDGHVIVAHGTYNQGANLTISSGVTLDMTAGGTLRMADGKQLTVNGTLNATNVTFTASNTSWRGLRFNAGSDGDLSSCDILHVGPAGGTANIAIYNASPRITSCTLGDEGGTYYGIFVSGSTAAPRIEHNDISVDGGVGVQFTNYAEAANFDYNIIRAPSGASAIQVNTQAALTSVDQNKLGSGYYPLSVINATIALHYNYWCNPYGYTHIFAYSYATVDADHNYFPNSDPHVNKDATSSVDVSASFPSNNYCSGIPKAVASGTPRLPDPAASGPDPAESPFLQGWAAPRQQKPEEAARIFKDIFTTTTDPGLAHQSLRGLAHTFTASRDPAVLDALLAWAEKPGAESLRPQSGRPGSDLGASLCESAGPCDNSGV